MRLMKVLLHQPSILLNIVLLNCLQALFNNGPLYLCSSYRMESLLAMNILCLGSQLSLPVLTLLHSLASGTTPLVPTTSSPPHPSSIHHHHHHHHHHHQPQQVHMPVSLGSDSHSFKDTPTIPSPTSEGTVKTSGEKNPFIFPLPKKGTRFMLPGSEVDATPFSANERGSEVATSSKRRVPVDTLNVLGMQPGFREPYPESVYTEAQSVYTEAHSVVSDGRLAGDLFHVNQHIGAPRVAKSHSWQGKIRTVSGQSVDLESVATQSLIDDESIPRTMNSSRASSHSQHLSRMGGLGSQSTLGQLSPSHSLVLTSSPWLKSSTSKNLDCSNDDRREKGEDMRRAVPPILLESDEFSDPVYCEKEKDGGSLQGTQRFEAGIETPIKIQVDSVESSSLRESLDRVGLLANEDCLRGPPTHPPGVSGRSVTLSLFGRNVETRCTHYTHSSSALTDGAGVPGSHVAPSTIYRHSVYSPLTLDVENEESCRLSSDRGAVTHARFESWPSEVALAYTLSMADVVIYGRTSVIQSTALEGMHGGDGGTERFGLKQLVQFSLTAHSPSGKSGVNVCCLAHM